VSPSLWIFLVVVTLIAGSVLQSRWLILSATALGAWLLIAYSWKRLALAKVIFQHRWRYRRGFPGEEITIKVTVENQKPLPLTWLRVTEPWPHQVFPEKDDEKRSYTVEQNELASLYALRPKQRITRQLKLELGERGVYKIGPATLESGDPFGFFSTQREQGTVEEITVFPRLLPFSNLGLRSNDPFGERSSKRRLFFDQNLPIGVRPYHPEDDFRRIHWSASARTGELQVKEYQPVSTRVMMVGLNVLTTAKPWLGTRRNLMEQLISTAASICYQGVNDGYAVGLVSNGCLTHADHPFILPPNRSPDQLATLLHALAAVTPYTSASFEAYLLNVMSKVPYGATLVLITGLNSDTLWATLQRLMKYRPVITLISLDETPPPKIQNVNMVHLPYLEGEMGT
jgi:uncharacterized protein (DUF58 family)